MEYIENATVLKDFIDKNISGKANVDHLVDFIGRGLGTLIARLHSKHIIHGDLTTSNILLKTDSTESLCSNESEGKKSFAVIIMQIRIATNLNIINISMIFLIDGP